MLSSSCDSEVEFYMHINIEAGWHARSLTRLGMHALLTLLGILFKGVSTRFGLRIVENCVENALGRTVGSAFPNLRLGSISFSETIFERIMDESFIPNNFEKSQRRRKCNCAMVAICHGGSQHFDPAGIHWASRYRCVDKASLGPLGQTRHRPATSINWPVRVRLGLAGKIAVAISDPTWPLETCLRYPL